MPGPVSDFLATMTQMVQMQQAAEQLRMQQSLAEVERLQTISGIASTIVNPEDRAKFAEVTAHLLPPEGVEIIKNAPPSLQAIQANVQRNRPQEELLREARVQGGLEMTAGQVEGARQADRTFGLQEQEFGLRERSFFEGNRQWEAQFARQMEQFQIQTGLDIRRLGQQDRALSQQDVSLGLQERQVNLQATGQAQQYGLGVLGAAAGTQAFPILLKSQVAGELGRLQRAYDTQQATMRPEARAAMQQEIADTRAALNDFDAWIASERARGTNVNSMDLNQIIAASGAAWDDMNTAATLAERQEAEKRYKMLQLMLEGQSASWIESHETWWDKLPLTKNFSSEQVTGAPRSTLPMPSQIRSRWNP